DVLNKKFQPTKFREGYDQDEVDDFLDEVVNTLRALDAENAELKTKLEAAQAGAGAGGAAPAAVAEQQTQQMDAVQDAPVEEEPQPGAAPGPDVASFAQAPSAAAGGEPASATGLIALAQRVHDEYVHNGRAEADRILGEARTEAERVAREAEETRNRTLGQLE